jgi:hypothetical protein
MYYTTTTTSYDTEDIIISDLDNIQVLSPSINAQKNSILYDNLKLPGGRRYQKDGNRLEKAFFNILPKTIKKDVRVNVKPLYLNGNAIIEFDMIYMSDSSKRIISFEIKGVNKYTTDDYNRQTKLLSQGLRQKKYLIENYNDYNINIIYCFVIGKTNKNNKNTKKTLSDSEWKSVLPVDITKSLDINFIKKLKNNGINVAIGETPQHCVNKALLIMNL